MVSVSKKLAQTIAPFTKEDLPDTIQVGMSELKVCHQQRYKCTHYLFQPFLYVLSLAELFVPCVATI